MEKLARALSDKHGLRVWWDAWEMLPGTIEQQCDQGIQRSRFTVVAVSRGALTSRWVNWEIAAAVRHGRRKSHIIPLRLDDLEIQPELQDLHWIDLLDPAEDASGLIRLASLIRALDAADTQERRGFRPPPEHGQPGAFPRPPQYGFQGRAPELHDLERAFRRGRGIVLHAMGGMGKTTLAGEAALWWTRSGLFRDGACFISFERPINAERVIAVLGEYCGGPNFHSLPASEQRRRAIEFMRDKAVLMVWDNYESVLPAFGAPTFVVPPSGGPALGVPPLGGSEFEVPPSGGSGPDRLKPELQTPYTEAVRRELAELFHDLTTGPGRGCVLVTCRPGDTGLPGARRFELHGLARADSLWLLHRILERDGASLSDPRLARDRLEPLLRDLADHPLSLELVGPHLRTMTPEQIRADFGKLVETMRQDSDQSRNTSLRASLEFSRRHLSPAARAALPWLGLFSGGVFEINLLAICQIEPAAWTAIRAELQGIALLRTEDDRQIGDRPFLRFHPTLAIASADAGLAERPEIRERFQKVYLGLMGTLEKALRGHQSRAALAILDREEMNWRTAVRWAIASGQHPIAAALGNTFSTYLQMSGRLRERDAWVQMLHEAVTQAGFTAEAADYERQHAWTQFTQGDPKGAVDKLRSLVQRLRQTTEFDPAVQLAMTTLMLGRVLDHAGATAQAVPVLREAGGLCERLVERAGGCPWERLLKSPDHAKAAVELANLSAAMGDLSTALRNAGKHEEALVIAEKALTIDERQGDRRQVAAGHGQCARILMEMGRFDEADTRNELALDAARQAGDKELEGGLLQHQGGLARQRNQLDRATLFYQLALQRFQEADAKGHMMRTYNLLGVAEQYAGRLAESLAWYGKSRELAVHLKDQPNLGAVAGNIANVHLMEGKAARELGDEGAARRHFEEARCSVEESLKVWQTQKNKPNEAKSLVQLAQAQFELRQLDEAEDCALRGLAIDEELEIVRELPSDYYTLSEIAAARGDTAAAAEWARKRDELRAELKRRAGGGGGIPSQMLRALEALTMACARAGFGGETLDPGAEEALAKLDGFDAPFPDFSASLRRLAAGELPSLPVHLPRELHDLLESIIKAIRDQTP
ncbi:MAG TPA: toll/interleukin-1 receptor domain-containing protein [Chthoniobacteraceae bacterium]|nr:toll/interleukin-1 receptor domain-containing protein [Chthoniobacteraceae bacterium]